MTASWPAPAKLNLFLHVTGRRPDGYHTLQTIFQFIDRCDRLRFEPNEEGDIRLANPLPGVPDEKNLVARAARLLREATGVRRGVTIHIEKNLPVGGGLGGGSSDAATTLMALNSLWECGLDTDRLAGLGLKLGADVPVFIHGTAAWAEGVGEQLSPVDPPKSCYLVLVPPVAVSTAAVFAEYDRESHLTPVSPPIRIRGFHADLTRNDLEPVVRRLYPEVDNALKWLAEFGEARMTGSGACVFLAVESEARGKKILAGWPGQGFVTRGCNRHPMLEESDTRYKIQDTKGEN